MKPAVVRLLLCVAVFGLWLGYLGYLVATRPRTPEGRPLVVSRPQIQASQVDVIAQVDDPTGEVEVVEVLYGAGLARGSKIRVRNLDRCGPVPWGEAPAVGARVVTPEGLGEVTGMKGGMARVVDVTLDDGRRIAIDSQVVSRPDWSGPGRYLLPLRRLERLAGRPDRYEVVPIPASPGFGDVTYRLHPPPGKEEADDPLFERRFPYFAYRIYRDTPEALAQYRRIKPGE